MWRMNVRETEILEVREKVTRKIYRGMNGEKAGRGEPKAHSEKSAIEVVGTRVQIERGKILETSSKRGTVGMRGKAKEIQLAGILN